jgi:hypothetical protein
MEIPLGFGAIVAPKDVDREKVSDEAGDAAIFAVSKVGLGRGRLAVGFPRWAVVSPLTAICPADWANLIRSERGFRLEMQSMNKRVLVQIE